MASKPRDRERARRERLGKINRDFARRHPGRAREERELRQQQSKARRSADRQKSAALPRDNGTPETQEHVRGMCQGAIARLYENGHITIDQLAASQQIRGVVERIGRDVSIGMVSLEARVDNSRRPDAGFFESLGAVRAEVAYGRWRDWLEAKTIGRGQRRSAAVAPVLAMIVDDMACKEAARRFRMRDATARRLLGEALDVWGDFLGTACDEIDEATLLAAQAGIL